MNVLVVGGCGYIGSYLVPFLLADGHKVTVHDTMWFGDGALPDNPNLDVHEVNLDAMPTIEDYYGFEAIIYLASLSNNTMCELNPVLDNDANRVMPHRTIRAASDAGVKRFIFASSVAAYGSSDAFATEETSLRPTTLYGAGKAYVESVLRKYQSSTFNTTVVRAASVCGYSTKMRFDLTLNKMLMDAMTKHVVRVNGGEQWRCHVSMKDIVRFYRDLLTLPLDKVSGKTFNVVSENQKVLNSAEMICELTKAKLEVGPATDNRSYKVDGSFAQTLWKPEHSLRNALEDIKVRFEVGYWPDHKHAHYENMRYDLAQSRPR